MEPVSIGTIAGLVEKCVSVFRTLHKSHEQYADISEKIESTHKLLRDINSAIESCGATYYDDKVIYNWMVDLEAIKRTIEDSIDNFNFDTIFPGNKDRDVEGILVPVIIGAKVVLMKPAAKALIEDIKKIKELVQEVKNNKVLLQDLIKHGKSTADNEGNITNHHGYGHAKVKDPVGIETPRDVLVQLLRKENIPKIVIVIYGPSGSGKSVLANAVYEDVENEFDFRAQVTASCEPTKLLEVIIKDFKFDLQQVGSNPDSYLRKQLIKESKNKNKRCIVEIEDIPNTYYWDMLQYAFPDETISVRLIVTTRTEEVAKHCSKSCQPYKMERLDKKAATKLLEEKAFQNSNRSVIAGDEELYDNALTLVLERCEYHPVAIADMGKHLDRVARWWDQKYWDFGKNIESFHGMKHVFDCSYRSLSYTTKTCLFSLLSTCPNGEEDGNINRKSVIRRLWLAEKLIHDDKETYDRSVMDFANRCFDNLINHNFIIPMKLSLSAKLKTFRVNRMMVPFIRAIPRNSGSWLDIHPEKKVEPSADTVRLSLHNSNTDYDMSSKPIGLSGIRLLTFHGKATNAPMKFESTKFLRALVLENIENLKEEDIDAFCCPSLLKYLSIRGSKCVSRLPGNIVELQMLETLDTRGTKVGEIPMDVVLLPELIHLLGEFQITGADKFLEEESMMKRVLSEAKDYLVPAGTKRETFKKAAFPKKTFVQVKDSKLQTLAGLVIHDGKSSDFVRLLPRMPMLSKVRILCGQTEDQTTACSPSSVSSPQTFTTSLHANVKKGCEKFHRKFQKLLHRGSTSLPSPTAESARGHNAHLVDSLKICLEKNVRFRSLSIDFSCCDESYCHLNFLDELKIDDFPQKKLKIDDMPPFLQSLKLNGNLTKFPMFILSLSENLNKLYLMGTNLAWGSVLSKLQKLTRLQFLKLKEDCLKPEEKVLNFEKSWFGGLERLCFEVETAPEIVIQDGAMKGLQSLQLRCKQWGGVNGIKYLGHLKEVIIPNVSGAVGVVLPQISEHVMKPKILTVEC